MAEVAERELPMGTQSTAGRNYWHGVLKTGGFTAIPRWTVAPRAGVGELDAPIPNDLAAAARQLAESLSISMSSVLLAAHVKVLSALSGDTDVVAGYVPAPGADPVPCPLSNRSGSWRSLLVDTHRSASELLMHRDFPIGELALELGVAVPAFETVVDPNGAGRRRRRRHRSAGRDVFPCGPAGAAGSTPDGCAGHGLRRTGSPGTTSGRWS